MNDRHRPKIPIATQRELLFEVRYRCACCCEPISLEKCHIVPWSKTKDHSAENLVVLCANCHTRSHKEDWPASQMRQFKKRPCALERDRMPPMTPGQRALVDLIVAQDPVDMNERERARFLRMVAAYADLSLNDVQLKDLRKANSSRIRLEMPKLAAQRLLDQFFNDKRYLDEFFDGFEVLSVRLVESSVSGSRENEAAFLELLELIGFQLRSMGVIKSDIDDLSQQVVANMLSAGYFADDWELDQRMRALTRVVCRHTAYRYWRQGSERKHRDTTYFKDIKRWEIDHTVQVENEDQLSDLLLQFSNSRGVREDTVQAIQMILDGITYTEVDSILDTPGVARSAARSFVRFAKRRIDENLES